MLDVTDMSHRALIMHAETSPCPEHTFDVYDWAIRVARPMICELVKRLEINKVLVDKAPIAGDQDDEAWINELLADKQRMDFLASSPLTFTLAALDRQWTEGSLRDLIDQAMRNAGIEVNLGA